MRVTLYHDSVTQFGHSEHHAPSQPWQVVFEELKRSGR